MGNRCVDWRAEWRSHCVHADVRIYETGLYHLSIHLCSAADCEQHCTRGLPGGGDRRRVERSAGLRGAGLPARRQHLRTGLLRETHHTKTEQQSGELMALPMIVVRIIFS